MSANVTAKHGHHYTVPPRFRIHRSPPPSPPLLPLLLLWLLLLLLIRTLTHTHRHTPTLAGPIESNFATDDDEVRLGTKRLALGRLKQCRARYHDLGAAH